MTDLDHYQAGRSIALIGYRGSGKSAVGRELASLTGLSLVDTDDLIAQKVGKSIAWIFSQQGEAEFRRLDPDEEPQDLDKVNKQRLAAVSLDVETRNKAFQVEPKESPKKEKSKKTKK